MTGWLLHERRWTNRTDRLQRGGDGGVAWLGATRACRPGESVGSARRIVDGV